MNTDPQSESQSPTRRRVWRRVAVAVCALIVLLGGYRIHSFLSPEPLEIGPDTTVIEGPLLPDGRVDYLTVLNDRISEGVTPENNAVVLLMQAFGSEIIPPETRGEFFRLLGVPAPALDGDYVINAESWLEEHVFSDRSIDWKTRQIILDRLFDARRQPWSADESPEVAAWLEAHDRALDLIVAASNRSRFFIPLVTTDGPPVIDSMHSVIPVLDGIRTAARLLASRAMLRIGDGELKLAWDDLLAFHRLSRLVSQGLNLSSDFIAFPLSAWASRSSEALLHDERLTGELARQIVADVETLSPQSGFATTFDVHERYAGLDVLQYLAQGNTTGISRRFQPTAGRGFDWNLIMRLTNQHHDTFVEAFSRPTHRERIETLRSLERERTRYPAEGISTPRLIGGFLIRGREQVSREFAEAFLMTERLSGNAILEARSECRLRLLRIALMLAAFRADHGSYPDTLATLTPGYLAEIPFDPFLDASFHYERTDTGYRLYSVGDNMTDDGGRTLDDWPQQDDILIETPLTDDSPATDRNAE